MTNTILDIPTYDPSMKIGDIIVVYKGSDKVNYKIIELTHPVKQVATCMVIRELNWVENGWFFIKLACRRVWRWLNGLLKKK